MTHTRIPALFVSPLVSWSIDGGVSVSLRRWCQHALELFREKSQIFDVQEISEEVTRQEVRTFLSAYRDKPGLLAFYGHGCGCATSLLAALDGEGGGNQVMGPRELDLLRNKIVYAVACYTGGDLGPSACEAGAKGYIGYQRQLDVGRGWMSPEGYPEAANEGLRVLRDGGTLGEAETAISREFEIWATRYSEDANLDPDFGRGLLNNQDALVRYGEPSTRLVQP